MRSASDDIYYLFNILVAAIACAALALGVLNYRGIKEINSKIEILERKINDNKISIHEIQKKKREIVSPAYPKKVKPAQHHKKKIIPSKTGPVTEKNNIEKKIIIKVNDSQQEKKKRSIDAIVTDLVDVVTK